VPPIFHSLHYGLHCSSCRDIAISQPRDPRVQILEPFLARFRDTIPHPNPMVLLCSGSNGYPPLASSRPRDLEYPNVGLSTCAFSILRDPLIPCHLSSQMNGYDLITPSSPRVLMPHNFAHQILGSLTCKLLSS
jgi:hypothetical protein